MASFCEAGSKGANWRLRIDDIDGPRSVAGSAQRIQHSLANYGLQWHGDVIWQSEHAARYREALAALVATGQVFNCQCSRRKLPQGQVYPGHCRGNILQDISDAKDDCALRLILPETLVFEDKIQGVHQVAVNKEVGDIIIWRRDKLVSYSLACAVDDAMDCTEVVRGADLLPSTAAQIAIINYLQLASPSYAHIPVAVDANDDKLSKHSKAKSIDSMDTLATLKQAWRFLGQQVFEAQDTSCFWVHAIEQWDISKVPNSMRKQVCFS